MPDLKSYPDTTYLVRDAALTKFMERYVGDLRLTEATNVREAFKAGWAASFATQEASVLAALKR